MNTLIALVALALFIVGIILAMRKQVLFGVVLCILAVILFAVRQSITDSTEDDPAALTIANYER